MCECCLCVHVGQCKNDLPRKWPRHVTYISLIFNPYFCLSARAMRQEDSSQEDGVLTRLVAQCLGYLNRPHILKEEGLFRVPGSVTDINRLRAAFTAGKRSIE